MNTTQAKKFGLIVAICIVQIVLIYCSALYIYQKMKKHSSKDGNKVSAAESKAALEHLDEDSLETKQTQPSPNEKEAQLEQLNSEPQQEKKDDAKETAQSSNNSDVEWNKYGINGHDALTSIQEVFSAIRPFVDIYGKKMASIEFKASMVNISPVSKQYIIDTTKESRVEKVYICLPNTKDSRAKEKAQEKVLAHLLYNISEFWIRSIVICCNSDDRENSTDFYILIAILSKLRECNKITLKNIANLKFGSEYESRLDLPKDPIINGQLKNVNVGIMGFFSIENIKVFMERIFVPSRKSIALITIFTYSPNKEKIYEIFDSHKLESNKKNETAIFCVCYPSKSMPNAI
ncbi:hypothetical protein NEFER03_0969 [Nematocida sp. LUAm3]|nr:hypothetical protein NEFER03_0969 [Nematocida sp. LUAm3]KAI5175427.1 hypothetical protein NEFER02_1356 [Nematocida sp. LUAm2]KAI5177616.1 hypothetical protein NEFER01_0840 [Nematocida sp. LUAm1]